MRFKGILVGGLAAGWCTVAAVSAAQQPVKKVAPAPADSKVSAEAAEFFEKHVRPVLAESCYSCHGPKLQQAGLRVDNLAGLLKGTDTGKKTLVAGSPEQSVLIQVLSHTGPVKMPPQGKLPQKSIDALTEWVKMGAPWPGSGADVAPVKDPKKHWAFQPVRNPAPPAVKNKAWVKSPIDAFILSALEKKGLKPAVSADRRTLIRRAYFDLTGLPPTAADVQAFVDDKSPNAYSKVVDKLLDSPAYGERWARYWLDVARYADTKGYVFTEERRYPYAYTYRDYVIRAFNEDKPYDQFLRDQLAADQVKGADDHRDMAAMGFLTLGRRFLNSQPDIIDDRIDVVFRGTQGLTVNCARCHDHKFDPIPTADYYSLYGVFASSNEPKDGPLLAPPERTAAYIAYETQLRTNEAAVQSFMQKKHQEILAFGRSKVAEALLAAREADGQKKDRNVVAEQRGLPGMLVHRWGNFLNDTRRNHHAVFTPWLQLAALPDAEFAAKVGPMAAAYAANQDPQKPVNALIAQAFAGPAPKSIEEVAERMAKVLTAPTKDQQIEHALDSIGGPLNIGVGDIEPFFDRADRDQLLVLRQKVDQLKANSPAAPPRAMVLVDNPNPVTPRIFRRGNPNNQGDPVPRQFLAVLSGPERKPFTPKGSGRLELAEAITSKSNPLTSRVMVNRVWGWHFGQALVNTPSDFGLRSEPPSNPDLLDFLASNFMENGWSLKKLHRMMMLSSTYQQVSIADPKNTQVDPENRLFSHMNRRRLDFEAMRDSLLWASGKLDATVGGPAIDIQTQPFIARRTVYGFIDRQNLPNLFRTFDFASPDTHSPGRFVTTVPQQALFMMNSPFSQEQARTLMARPEIAGAKTATEKVQQLYRTVYARDAAPDEVALAARFLKAFEEGGAGPSTWQYGFGEVDEAKGRVRQFQALSHFSGASWQGSAKLPDPATGWCMLNAQGGHAGSDLAHATIRRWTAPADGTVAISGTLVHGRAEGDGVRARIVSSRTGVLGSWNAFNNQADVKVAQVAVKAGDTLDFVVDCRTNSNFDSFNWAPVLRLTAAPKAGETAEWNASTAFAGPAGKTATGLSAWEKYAQVLLMSNEFAFVD